MTYAIDIVDSGEFQLSAQDVLAAEGSLEDVTRKQINTLNETKLCSIKEHTQTTSKKLPRRSNK